MCTKRNGSSLFPFAYKPKAKNSSFEVTQNDISLIIKTLDPWKRHGCDNTSIIMNYICCESIALPLKLIFEIGFELAKKYKFEIFAKNSIQSSCS